MTDRIHAYLDGELPLAALSPDERAAASRLQAASEHAVRHLAATRVPELVGRVMAALPAPAPVAAPAAPAAPAPRWRRAAAWLWTPRPVTLAWRPAYGLTGALAALLATTLVPGAERGLPADTPSARLAEAPAPDPVVYVQFRLEAQDAQQVSLAGTFTGWKPRVALRETQPGVWTALVPLRPGVHDYAFVVDGERWVADPAAPQVDDDFGGTNSRISLPALGAQA